MQIIDKNQALELMGQTNGQVFSAVFIKKDGSIRHMNCRTGVTKHLKGGELKFTPSDKGLFSVYDMQSKGYRFVNINTLKSLQISNIFYTIK